MAEVGSRLRYEGTDEQFVFVSFGTHANGNTCVNAYDPNRTQRALRPERVTVYIPPVPKKRRKTI